MAKGKNRSAWDKRQEKMAKAKESKNMDLYGVFETGTETRIYLGDGVSLDEAKRLNNGLVNSGEVRLVKSAETE